MQTITFEPLRWQDDAARVIIRNQNAHPDALFQVTAPRDVRSMAIGRPVEELPRILAILGPAHHIAGAKALDRLFDIQVPEPAQNMRNALLATYVFVEHLKKFSFLLLSECNPFAELRLVRKSERQSLALLEDIQHTIALGQEAGRILGGRSDHPITAIAGGISRFLKKEAYERLSEIASGCLAAAKRIAAVLHETALHPGGPLRTVDEVFIDRMPYLTVSAASPDSQEITVQLKEDGDNTLASYKEKELGDAIGIQKEPWTNAPFAFVHANGWPGLDTDSTAGLFFVGPLARLNSGQTLPTPLAEKERVRMIEKLGPPPHVSVKAAYHALLVEILQAAEQITA